jgi:hypothetical protein
MKTIPAGIRSINGIRKRTPTPDATPVLTLDSDKTPSTGSALAMTTDTIVAKEQGQLGFIHGMGLGRGRAPSQRGLGQCHMSF